MDKRPRSHTNLYLQVGAVLLGLGFALGSASPGSAQSTSQIARYEANDLSTAVADAERSKAAAPNRHVLIVFDIDNTLMTMPQFLGSDQWFNYHAGLVTAAKDPDFASFGDLIAAQTALFSLAAMKPTQDETGQLLEKASAAGVDVYLLSARGPELFNATKRELDRNGITLRAPQTCSFIICSLGGAYGDVEIRRAVASFGGTSAPNPYRQIVIRDGIMLVAGQDKGTMLRVLLAAIPSGPYDKIVFVDDTQKNIDSVAASGLPVPLALYHYTRVPTALSSKDIKDSDRQWKVFKGTVCSVVFASFCQMKP